MESAERIGIVLEGHVQAQKTFPNGSQVNVSVRGLGELIGPAAVFSSSRKYPCDVVAIDPATVMMFRREDVLVLILRYFLLALGTVIFTLPMIYMISTSLRPNGALYECHAVLRFRLFVISPLYNFAEISARGDGGLL